jgi:hypothetical protein
MTEPKNSAAPAEAGVATTKLPVFEVASVERTDAPEGGIGRNWYRYVLKSHCSTITGQRQGSRQFVHDYATQCAEQLNARAASCKSIWNPRGRKPAAATR